MRFSSSTFDAMGTTITVLGPNGLAAAIPAVRDLFEREEQRFSRFRDDSELSLVNARAGAPTQVSAPFAEVLRLALHGARSTRGLFDPTLLEEIRTAGYDRDFDQMTPDRSPWVGTSSEDAAGPRDARWPEVQLDGCTVTMPSDVGLDFGGVAKGWTVDRAAELLAARLGWGLVDAGGDLRLLGSSAPPISVGIEDPFDGTMAAQVELEQGALATSSIMRRRWNGGHHLIDPRTGRPSRAGVVQATTWAPTCATAEIRAKAAVLTGTAVLAGSPAAVILDDGTMLTSFGESGHAPYEEVA